MAIILKRLVSATIAGLAVCAALALPAGSAVAGPPCSSGTHWDDIIHSCV